MVVGNTDFGLRGVERSVTTDTLVNSLFLSLVVLASASILGAILAKYLQLKSATIDTQTTREDKFLKITEIL